MWYYLLPKDGSMLVGEQVVDGKKYKFASSGALIDASRNWQISNGVLYYQNKGQRSYKLPSNGIIIISLKEQRMWGYKNGKWMATPVTTGKNSTPTYPGWFKINSKYRSIYLTSSTYSSFVSYWMAYSGSSYGIHDASWRDVFGTQSYTYNGSHGCINTPKREVKKFYETFSVGTDVWIY